MKKQLNEEDFYNYWLEKHHGVKIRDIMKNEPELILTLEWYKKYAVTKAQHDEWYEWAITTVMKHYRCGRKTAMKYFTFSYMNVAPFIKDEEN